jgi:DNA-binding HxlR family transcriptional regulator
MRLGELAKEPGGPSKTTVRGCLDELVALGAVAKKGGGMPYAVRNELTGVGRDLLRLVDEVDAWLARAPGGPIPIGGAAAKAAIRALVGGWESTMLHALAARPRSLAALDRAIDWLSYPALEHRLTALRAAGLVEPASPEPGRPYLICRWGREAAGPLAAAVRFERARMAEETPPPAPADEEALSLLAPGA